MRIVSWNVNGIRSEKKPPLRDLTRLLQADILCFQETKINRQSVDHHLAIIPNFDCFYSFASTKYAKAGYSGVATICSHRCRPFDVSDHLVDSDLLLSGDPLLENLSEEDLTALDSEGRALLTYHNICQSDCDDDRFKLCLINVYCHRFDCDDEERLLNKMRYHHLLQRRILQLESQGFRVLLVGDMNIAKERIDHCDPDSHPLFDSQPHRLWLREFLASGLNGGDDPGRIDLFRHFHPNERLAFTCWNTALNARATNYGTRIDYAIADKLSVTLGSFTACDHMTDVLGSDHCPVSIDCNWSFVPSSTLPTKATTCWPEFRGGTQRTLMEYFSSVNNSAVVNVPAREKSLPPTSQPFIGDSSGGKWPKNRDGLRPKCSTSLSTEWTRLFSSPASPPLCKGHSEHCLQRIVKKPGPNKNRQFWICNRPVGPKQNPNSRCDFFQWAK